MDLILRIKADGTVETGAQLDKLATKINQAYSSKQMAAQKHWQTELADSARKQRKDVFDRLSAEEKLLKLTERRSHIEARLIRARTEGNQYRATAMQTQLSRINTQMAGLGSTGFFGGIANAMGFGSGTGGLAGAFTGGALGGMVGAAIVGLGYQVIGAIRNGLASAREWAAELEALADAYRVPDADVERLRQAIYLAHASEGRVFGGLGRLEAARGLAATDPAKAALLARYDISKEAAAGEGSTLDLAGTIVRSLGKAGVTSQDIAPLTQLLGARPQKTVLALQKFLTGAHDEKTDKETGAAIDQSARFSREHEVIRNRFQKAFAETETRFARSLAPTKNLKDLPGGFLDMLTSPWPLLKGLVQSAKGLAAAVQPEIPLAPAAGLGPRTAGTGTISRPPTRALDAWASVDSLRRIGGFVGAGPGAYERQAAQTHQDLERIRQEISRLRTDVNREAIVQ